MVDATVRINANRKNMITPQCGRGSLVLRENASRFQFGYSRLIIVFSAPFVSLWDDANENGKVVLPPG